MNYKSESSVLQTCLFLLLTVSLCFMLKARDFTYSGDFFKQVENEGAQYLTGLCPALGRNFRFLQVLLMPLLIADPVLHVFYLAGYMRQRMYVLSAKQSHRSCVQLMTVVTGEVWGTLGLVHQPYKSMADGSAFSLRPHERMQDRLLQMGDPDVMPNPSGPYAHQNVYLSNASMIWYAEVILFGDLIFFFKINMDK